MTNPLLPDPAVSDEPVDCDEPMGPPAPYQAENDANGAAARRDTHLIRVIVLGWCLWLIGSWVVALWSGSATPAARWMLLSTTVGLTALWPIVRLSLEAPSSLAPVRVVAVEWLALAGILQAVVWPLALTAGWEASQTLWIDGAVLAWSLVTASIVALALRSRRAGHRAVAAALCMLFLFGEPLAVGLMAAPHGAGVVMRITPFQTLWALTDEGRLWTMTSWRVNVGAAMVAALLSWLVVLATCAWTAPSDSRKASP